MRIDLRLEPEEGNQSGGLGVLRIAAVLARDKALYPSLDTRVDDFDLVC
jgi:hypothetical protein